MRREAALAAGVLAPWLLWQAVHAGTVPPALSGYYGSYGLFYLSSLGADWLTVAGRVPLHNVGYVLASLGTPLVGGDWLPHGLVLAAGAVLVGACVRARPVHEGVVLGVVFYLAVTTAWPFPPDRLVAGVLPILILVAAAGAGRWRWVPVTFAGIVATVGLVTGEALDRHRKRAAAATRLAAEVRPIVPATGTLATSNPALHYLAFGVPTVPNQRMRSYRAYRLGYWATAWGLGDDLWAIVDRYHPGAVLVERRGVEGRYAAGSLKRQCPALFEPLWESTDGIEFLWKVRPNTACAPEQTRL